jgi:hypothetical protein
MKNARNKTDNATLCIVGQALAGIPDGYWSALDRLVNLPWNEGGVSADEVAMIMHQSGLRGSPTAITRHRRGLCTCKKGMK